MSVREGTKARVRPPDVQADRQWLQRLYRRYHDPRFIRPDPLRFVHQFNDAADQEVAGLVASLLAYGNVKAIERSVKRAMEVMGPKPGRWIVEQPPSVIRRRFRGFRHRVTSDAQMSGLLVGAGAVVRRFGSLNERFVRDLAHDDETVVPALGSFVDGLAEEAAVDLSHLLPQPRRGSACKRLHLYLRWMVRRDLVDPGPWEGVSRAQLIMPVDTHVHRIALERGWTRRKTATGATALEITTHLRRIRPDDPLRFDFAMTRPGIRNEPESITSTCNARAGQRIPRPKRSQRGAKESS